jgi:hypothetical protein
VLVFEVRTSPSNHLFVHLQVETINFNPSIFLFFFSGGELSDIVNCIPQKFPYNFERPQRTYNLW